LRGMGDISAFQGVALDHIAYCTRTAFRPPHIQPSSSCQPGLGWFSQTRYAETNPTVLVHYFIQIRTRPCPFELEGVRAKAVPGHAYSHSPLNQFYNSEHVPAR
jgi:hypothetical protein